MAKSDANSPQSKPRKLIEAIEILKALGFAAKQTNEVAGYTLLALANLRPQQAWSEAEAPQRGITPIIKFVQETYNVAYAPNTRETVRDEAVKFFVEAGMLLRNPDDPLRAPNSMKTVYQIERHALELIRSFGSDRWEVKLRKYLESREHIRKELKRERLLARIPVTLPSGEKVCLSPGGQNPLIKIVIDEFCPRFASGGKVLYIGDAENKFLHLDDGYLRCLGVTVPAPAKMPDVIIHDIKRDWLLLIEAVMSAGPVDGKRRKELKELFAGCQIGLVFVTAFPSRDIMRRFLGQISWETEVWVADNPDHLIHFNGERFLGPYPDVTPRKE